MDTRVLFLSERQPQHMAAVQGEDFITRLLSGARGPATLIKSTRHI